MAMWGCDYDTTTYENDWTNYLTDYTAADDWTNYPTDYTVADDWTNWDPNVLLNYGYTVDTQGNYIRPDGTVAGTWNPSNPELGAVQTWQQGGGQAAMDYYNSDQYWLDNGWTKDVNGNWASPGAQGTTSTGGGTTGAITGLTGLLSSLVGKNSTLGQLLNSDSGGMLLQGISGLLGSYLSSQDMQEKLNLQAKITETIERQGWAPELAQEFMGSLDTYKTYMSQMPQAGFGTSEQDMYNQMMTQLSGQGALQGDLVTRQALESAMQSAAPWEQYQNSQDYMNQFLNQQEAQTAKELQKKYGAMVGISTEHGLALEQMIKEDQAARLAALQTASQMEQAYAPMFQQSAQTSATIAPQLGGTYQTLTNAPTYLGLAGTPRTTQMSDVIKQQPVIGAYPGMVAGGFGAAMQPSTSTKVTAAQGYDPTDKWWYGGLANAVGQVGKTLATDTARTTGAAT